MQKDAMCQKSRALPLSQTYPLWDKADAAAAVTAQHSQRTHLIISLTVKKKKSWEK